MPKPHPITKVAEDARRLLQHQVISLDAPGSLLRDAQVMIDAIGTQGTLTQSNRGNLPSRMLPGLNARLSDPLEIQLTRPLLRDYPNVAGIYILFRVLDLVRADATRVWVDSEQLAVWNMLNPTERYFALLETWLYRADGLVLGGESRSHVDSFDQKLRFLSETLSVRWKTFDDWVHKDSFNSCGLSAWNVQLMVRLGLMEVVPSRVENRRPDCGSRGWMMAKGRRTPWGEAVAWGLHEHVLSQVEPDDDPRWFEPDEPATPGMLQPVFQPFFPEYQRLFGPPPTPVHAGVYVFKVSVKERSGSPSVWRRLAVPDQSTLYDVGAAVLKAFKFFDEDHMHAFLYRDRTGRRCVAHHPYSEEEPSSDAHTIGELDLPEKQDLEFVFDFGANWRFTLRLERIEPPDPTLKKPKVIESVGTPPKQYESMEY